MDKVSDSSNVQEVIDFNPVGVFTPEIASIFVEVPEDTKVGDSVDSEGNWTKFIPPDPVVPDPVPDPKVPLTKLEYMNRFTDAELEGIYTAAKSTIAIEIWLEKFKLATDINLEDARTIAGVQALEAAGLLAVGRAAEILA